MFCAGPNFLSQPKNLTAFSASSKTFVPAHQPILLNANHLFLWHKIFVTGTICKFGPVLTKHFVTSKRTRHNFTIGLDFSCRGCLYSQLPNKQVGPNKKVGLLF